MSQVGGRLLGTGVYGCTFEPAPRCAGGSVFKTIAGMPAVGKVVIEDIEDELSIGRAIMGLPLAKQYFALPTQSCKPEIPIQDPDAGSCDVLKQPFASPQMLIMPSAGEQLLRYAGNLPRLAVNFDRLFTHLLEGAVIYQRAGYVHNDIHMGNVLVDSVGVPRFIDFGLGFRVQNVNTWPDANLSTRFRAKYVWQAPEVHTWRMVMNRVRVAEGVRQLREANPEYIQMENQFPGRPRAHDALASLVVATPGFGETNASGAFVRAYGKKFDSWRIGLCMWMLWYDLLQWSGFQKTALWERRDLIRRVIGRLTDFDPRRRADVAEALRMLAPNNRLAAPAAPAPV